MGNQKSRVIEVEDVEAKLSLCQLINQKKCSVYGSVHYIRYKGNEFYLGESQNNAPPHPSSIHYLIQPNLLLIPHFTLLEDTCPDSLDSLLNVIIGIAEMGLNGILGMGHRRVAYSGRWGIAGEKDINWAYSQICQDGDSSGVFLSPQLMLSFSQRKSIPIHNPIKSDIFALGIMLIEIIFQQCLDTIFDYHNYEIRLKPILQKLNMIRNEFGESVYEMFVGMLEIEEEDRLDFQQLLNLTNSIRKPKMLSSYMTTSNNSRNMENSKQRTPGRQLNQIQTNRTPKAANNTYMNNVSPFRTRFAGEARVPQRLGKTPERARGPSQRQKGISRSPLRRDLKINTRFDKENAYGNKAIMTPKQLSYQNRGMYSPISRR